MGARNIDYFESPHDFCTNAQLQQYLVTNKYAFHPCGDFKKSLKLVEQCEIFKVTAVPAYEVRDVCVDDTVVLMAWCISLILLAFLPYQEFQAGSLSEHFIGAAILPDIIHHAFQGDRAKFLTGQHTLR